MLLFKEGRIYYGSCRNVCIGFIFVVLTQFGSSDTFHNVSDYEFGEAGARQELFGALL